MATTGKDKWEKYFKNNEVETFVKANSSNSKDQNYIYDLTGLKTNKRLEHGHSVTVMKTGVYYDNGSYANKVLVEYDRGQLGYLHINCVDKVKNGRATMQIESAKLINLGEDIIVDSLNGQTNVPCKAFRTPQSLSTSIISGLENEPSVPDYITEQFTEYFAHDLVSGIKGISWNAGIGDKEKNTLAAYLGELLIGYMALSRDSDAFNVPEIVAYDIEYFAVPTDPSFPGIDSFIQYKSKGKKTSGGKYLISSKAGRGAKASIWNNVMPLVVNAKKKNSSGWQSLSRNSILKKLVSSFEAVPNAAANGKKVVYHFGVNHILNQAANATDAYSLFTKLKSGRMSSENRSLLEQARQIQAGLSSQNYPEAASRDVKTNLNASGGKAMTVFFARYIADELMKDQQAINFILSCLSGKKFYQANLNMSRWRSGTILYSTTHVTDTSIKITGTKSGTNSLDATQGTVNYELEFK
jgi:hypothetical protein